MKRRHSDGITHAASKVIDYVGVIAILSLILAAVLYSLGRDGAAALALTGSCVTGMLALLGQTRPPAPEVQEVVGPNGGAVPVAETAPTLKPPTPTEDEPQGETE